MAIDPNAIIDHEPMSGFCAGIAAIRLGRNAFNGSDILSIRSASPSIVTDWGIGCAAMLALGSFVRRILVCAMPRKAAS